MYLESRLGGAARAKGTALGMEGSLGPWALRLLKEGEQRLLRSLALPSHRPTPDPRIHQGILAPRYLDFATVY